MVYSVLSFSHVKGGDEGGGTGTQILYLNFFDLGASTRLPRPSRDRPRFLHMERIGGGVCFPLSFGRSSARPSVIRRIRKTRRQILSSEGNGWSRNRGTMSPGGGLNAGCISLVFLCCSRRSPAPQGLIVGRACRPSAPRFPDHPPTRISFLTFVEISLLNLYGGRSSHLLFSSTRTGSPT